MYMWKLIIHNVVYLYGVYVYTLNSVNGASILSEDRSFKLSFCLLGCKEKIGC